LPAWELLILVSVIATNLFPSPDENRPEPVERVSSCSETEVHGGDDEGRVPVAQGHCEQLDQHSVALLISFFQLLDRWDREALQAENSLRTSAPTQILDRVFSRRKSE
jgi:hypothetical protein